jgi:integration host factor subunit alpha
VVIKGNLKKTDLIKNLSKKTGYSDLFSKKLINDLVKIIILYTKLNKLIIKGIGTFKIIDKKERLGRNPKTGEQFIITARKSIKFIASKKLTNYLNK